MTSPDDLSASAQAAHAVATMDAPLLAGLLLKLKEECEAQHARAEAAEADVLRLRTALQMYGQHLGDCGVWFCETCHRRLVNNQHHVSSGATHPFKPKPCTCGFSAVSEGGTDVTPR
jgi:hypothetical protein